MSPPKLTSAFESSLSEFVIDDTDQYKIESSVSHTANICNTEITWTRYSPDVHVANLEDVLKFIRTFIPPPEEFEAKFKSPCWYVNFTIPNYISAPKYIHLYLNKSDILKAIEDSTGKSKSLLCLPAFFSGTLPKTGSTEVYDMLTKHPLIHKSKVKEPKWLDRFTTELTDKNVSLETKKLRLFSYIANNHILMSDEMKQNLLTVDGSATTIHNIGHGPNPCFVPQLVKEILPDAKFVVTLRNPLERLYSGIWHLMKIDEPNFDGHASHIPDYFHRCMIAQMMWFTRCLKESSVSSCVFEQQVLLPLEPRYRDAFCLTGLRTSMYYFHLLVWFKYFPRENFYFVRLEDLKKNPSQIMNEIADFLDIPHFKSGIFDDLISHPSNVFATRFSEVKVLPMLPETKPVLEKFFKPFNQALARLLEDERYLWKDN